MRKLVKDNRGELRSNVKNLQHIAEVLGNHPDDIEEILTDGPTALSNVTLTYNGDGGTLDNRADVTELIAGALGGILAPEVRRERWLSCAASSLTTDADPTNGCPGLDGLLGILFPGLNLTAKTSPAGLADALKDATKPGAEKPKSPDKALGSLQEMLGGGN